MSENNRSTTQPGKISKSTRQIFSSIFVVAICWFFLKLGGLLVSVAITHVWEKDDPVIGAYALLYRQLIMMFIYPSILAVFRPAFIPLYNEIKNQEGEDRATVFAHGVLEIGMLLALLVVGVLWIFPEFAVSALAPGFSGEAFSVSVRMLREMAPGILCLLFAGMYILFFHAEKKFGVPHSAEAIQKIGWGIGIVVCALVLGWEHRAIGITFSIACLVQLIVSVIGMQREFGWIFKATGINKWLQTWGRRAGWLALPLIVGIFGARLRDLLTLRLQSYLDMVRFNSVELARQLTNVPLVFLGQIVSIVMLPHLASIFHEEGAKKHQKTLEGTIEILCLLSLPVIAVTFVLGKELMAFFFIDAHWTEVSYTACSQGALAIRVIVLGLTFMMLENILLPGLFSIKSMWWPVIWGLLASFFQILCLAGLASANLSPDSALLLAGVAFVYPLSRIFKNGILFLILKRKTHIFAGSAFGILLFKIAILFTATLGLAFLSRWGTIQLIGWIPTEADVLVYKSKIAVLLAVPAAITILGFLALVWMSGYKQHFLDLYAMAKDLRKKRQASN